MKRTATFSRNPLVEKMRNMNLLFVFLFVCFSFNGFGQDTTATVKTQYVKIAVGMHILDCPVLPPQLKQKLMTVKGIKDYHEDRKTDSIYFNIPEGAISKEQITAVALRCAFPASAIAVSMSDKPFTH